MFYCRDFDGDSVFLCNNKEVVSSKVNKPMIIDIDDKITAKKLEYNMENIIDYELNSRDTRIRRNNKYSVLVF